MSGLSVRVRFEEVLAFWVESFSNEFPWFVPFSLIIMSVYTKYFTAKAYKLINAKISS